MPIQPLTGLPRISRSSLTGDVRGSAALEFGLVAMPFFALILAILQITMTFFAQQTLETAADKAVRQLVVGSAQKANTTKDQFKATVCSKLPTYMKCANVMVDVRAASTFSSVDVTAPTITYDGSGNPNNDWQFSPGGGGVITIARVMYVWNTQTGPLGFDISTMTGKRRLLSAVSVFKTEPYQ